MPYLLVTSHHTCTGTVNVGDEYADSNLMEFLGAKKNHYGVYECKLYPRRVLDLLETKGYKVVAMTAGGESGSFRVFWTLHKE